MVKSVAADELREAASGGEAVVKPAFTVYQAYRVSRFCDRCALDRSLVLLVNCYGTVRATKSVAADELREAASGGEAVVKPAFTVYQTDRVYRFCDRCTLDRSLVLLVSGYRAVCCLVPSDDVQLFPPVNDCSHTPPGAHGRAVIGQVGERYEVAE